MTYYHGGKKKIGKDIALIISDIYRILNDDIPVEGYCEPFMGMAGVYCHIPALLGPHITYLAGDTNRELVQMWKATQKGWKPPKTCSKKEYERVKRSRSSPTRTFIGYARDFRGHLFRGFSHTANVAHQSASVISCSNALKSVEIFNTDYESFSDIKNFIIYCDPPYAETEGYLEKFDSDAFWEWCIKMAKRNTVLVSEYSSPSQFDDNLHLIYEKGREKLWIVSP